MHLAGVFLSFCWYGNGCNVHAPLFNRYSFCNKLQEVVFVGEDARKGAGHDILLDELGECREMVEDRFSIS